jgi:hypothetical protein
VKSLTRIEIARIPPPFRPSPPRGCSGSTRVARLASWQKPRAERAGLWSGFAAIAASSCHG